VSKLILSDKKVKKTERHRSGHNTIHNTINFKISENSLDFISPVIKKILSLSLPESSGKNGNLSGVVFKYRY
jgi:hypothetical protein